MIYLGIRALRSPTATKRSFQTDARSGIKDVRFYELLFRVGPV